MNFKKTVDTSFKGVFGIFHFQFLFFFSEVYFCSTNGKDSLTLTYNYFFQNQNNTKATQAFAARPLIWGKKI